MYIHYIDNLQHVIYIPQVRTMVDEIYSNIKNAEKLVPGQLALFLAILASAAAIYQFFTDDVPLELSISDASQVSLYWTNSALEMLDVSRRTCEGVIEDIQATILLSFLLYHLEGFSARARGLFASALCIARDLSLHKIDLPSSQASDARTQTDAISLEIKRRVFWHAVATDWLVYLNALDNFDLLSPLRKVPRLDPQYPPLINLTICWVRRILVAETLLILIHPGFYLSAAVPKKAPIQCNLDICL